MWGEGIKPNSRLWHSAELALYKEIEEIVRDMRAFFANPVRDETKLTRENCLQAICPGVGRLMNWESDLNYGNCWHYVFPHFIPFPFVSSIPRPHSFSPSLHWLNSIVVIALTIETLVFGNLLFGKTNKLFIIFITKFVTSFKVIISKRCLHLWLGSFLLLECAISIRLQNFPEPLIKIWLYSFILL
jgi:hypothetical protein